MRTAILFTPALPRLNSNSLAIIFLACSVLSACGVDSQEVGGGNNIEKESLHNAANAKPWSGIAEGYVTSADPTDRIDLFVRLGKLLAAASVYQQRASELRSERNPDTERIKQIHTRVAAVFDEKLLASYAAIHRSVEEKMGLSKLQPSLQDMLIELTQDQHIADLIHVDRTKRDKQLVANQKTLDLMSRLHSVALAFFPSRHEYLLASSALARQAGDKMATAVSANGIVLDADLLQEAYALMDRSVKLDPRNISFCNSQRVPIREHKDAIDDLLNKMVPFKLGEKLSVTASDSYNLAKKAQAAGERFPVEDSTKCD